MFPINHYSARLSTLGSLPKIVLIEQIHHEVRAHMIFTPLSLPLPFSSRLLLL